MKVLIDTPLKFPYDDLADPVRALGFSKKIILPTAPVGLPNLTGMVWIWQSRPSQQTILFSGKALTK